MFEAEDFNIETFQKEVIQKYYDLKRFKELESDILKNIEIGSKKHWDSWFSRFFFNIATTFGKMGFREYSHRPNVIEFERKSKFLLAQKKIQETLCSFLQQQDSGEELSEEQLIETIVNSLGEANLRKEFSIKLEPELFAFLCYELLLIGIKRYCQEQYLRQIQSLPENW